MKRLLALLMGVMKDMNLSVRWLTKLSIRVLLMCPDLLIQTVHQYIIINNVKKGHPNFKPPPDEQERQERPPDELLLDVDSLNNYVVNSSNNNTGPAEGEHQSAMVVVAPAEMRW